MQLTITDAARGASGRARPLAATAGAWLLAALGAWALRGRGDLGSQTLPIVLAAAWTGLWLPAWAGALVCVGATLAFNWFFVPPEGSLRVDLRHHLLLLAAMLAVSVGVAALVARQRALAEREATNVRRLGELLALSERLRAALSLDDVQLALGKALEPFGFSGLALMARGVGGGTDDEATAGNPDDDERVGLRLCLLQADAFGPGTGRYEDQPHLYLPLRGHGAAVGAVVLRHEAGEADEVGGAVDAQTRQHVQALCNQGALVIELNLMQRSAERDARRADEQQMRSTVLTAIAHDFRTPLAAILGAASALREQGERIGAPQRLRLLDSISDEVDRLGRLTDNALQLARLGSPDAQVAMDWQSAEEMLGSVLARVRRRDPRRRVKARIEPALPLLRCNAVLVVQLLENLVDNALKYGSDEAPIELLAKRDGNLLLLAVRDRGPGVPPAWRQRIFELFQRVDSGSGADPGSVDARAAGVGLAVYRAIAQVHGGSLQYRARRHGGASFELRLPLGDEGAAAAGVDK